MWSIRTESGKPSRLIVVARGENRSGGAPRHCAEEWRSAPVVFVKSMRKKELSLNEDTLGGGLDRARWLQVTWWNAIPTSSLMRGRAPDIAPVHRRRSKCGHRESVKRNVSPTSAIFCVAIRVRAAPACVRWRKLMHDAACLPSRPNATFQTGCDFSITADDVSRIACSRSLSHHHPSSRANPIKA